MMSSSDSPIFSTNICNITSSDYLREVFHSIIKNNWSYILLAIALIICGIYFDWRFIIVLLILIFVGLPMLAFFLYAWHGLKPESRFSIMVKHIDFYQDNILLIHTDENEVAHITKLPYSDFSNCGCRNGNIILTFTHSKHTFFIFPTESITDTQQTTPLLDFLRDKIKKS